MSVDGIDRLAVLVHEVRSPVAALAAIADAYGSAAARERGSLAGLALGACRGIERLVVDAAVGSVRLEQTDLARLAEDAAAAARLGGSDVRVVVLRSANVRADPVRLRQALDNLLSNAARHAGKGEIVVEVGRADGVAQVSVSDTGPGILEADRQRIFEPGVRLGGAEGSGLGLSLARAIAEAHGGTLTVTSRPGEGATFALSVPQRGSG
jgi:two-component system OmpR family sensor kinase